MVIDSPRTDAFFFDDFLSAVLMRWEVRVLLERSREMREKSESNDDQSDDAEGGIESIPTQVSNSSR